MRPTNIFKIYEHLFRNTDIKAHGKTTYDTYGIKKILFIKPIIFISYDIFIIIGRLLKKDNMLIFNIELLSLFSLYKSIKYVIVKDNIKPVL